VKVSLSPRQANETTLNVEPVQSFYCYYYYARARSDVFFLLRLCNGQGKHRLMGCAEYRCLRASSRLFGIFDSKTYLLLSALCGGHNWIRAIEQSFLCWWTSYFIHVSPMYMQVLHLLLMKKQFRFLFLCIYATLVFFRQL